MKNYLLINHNGTRFVGKATDDNCDYGHYVSVIRESNGCEVSGELMGVQIYFSSLPGNNSTYLKVFKTESGFLLNLLRLRRNNITKMQRISKEVSVKTKILDHWIEFNNIAQLEEKDDIPLSFMVHEFIEKFKKGDVV